MGGSYLTRGVHLIGIYEIRCTANDKRYIGSAANLVHRWQDHRRDLKNGIHKNPNLQRAWKKYGEDAFVWTVLEELSDRIQLIVREQYHIDVALIDGVRLFNATLTAGSSLGTKHSDASKAKMATAKRGVPRSAAARAAVSAGGERRFIENPADPVELLERFISKGWAANRARTHCKHGHEFTPENTIYDSEGARGCRQCRRASFRRWYARQKSAA